MRVKRKTFTRAELLEIPQDERDYWRNRHAPRVIDVAPRQTGIIGWISRKSWFQIIKLVLQLYIGLFIGVLVFIFAVVMWP